MMKSEVYWLPLDGPGRLAVMPRPRGGDWLDDKLRSLRGAGVTTFVCAPIADERAALSLERLEEACAFVGLALLSLPIRDRDVPPASGTVLALMTDLVERLARGEGVAVHCRAGIGRAALLAACVLVRLGVHADDALLLIGRARLRRAGHAGAARLGGRLRATPRQRVAAPSDRSVPPARGASRVSTGAPGR